jgi:hypothetical protein
MDRGKLSIPRGSGQKNYAGGRPSVENIFLAATNAKPKVLDWLDGNWKAVVFAGHDFSGRCIEFHHPKRASRLVEWLSSEQQQFGFTHRILSSLSLGVANHWFRSILRRESTQHGLACSSRHQYSRGEFDCHDRALRLGCDSVNNAIGQKPRHH